MKTSTLVKVAMQSIRKNKMRTMLTMLGIVIGVGAVIVMVAVGYGAQSRIADQIGKDHHRRPGGDQPRGELAAARRVAAARRLGLDGADDLDAVGVGEVEVADQRGGRCRLAPHRGSAAFTPADPGERERLAVVLMQPRDVDLEHRAATR